MKNILFDNFINDDIKLDCLAEKAILENPLSVNKSHQNLGLSQNEVAEPKFDFDKELEKAMDLHDKLLKELVDK